MKRYWTWPIACYLFLGGLGGGALACAAILELLVSPTISLGPVLAFGVFIAVAALTIGTGLLVFELGQPKVFLRAFVTKTAIIKWGAVMLSVAMVFGVLYVTCFLSFLGFLPWYGSIVFADFALAVAGIIGTGLMIYTGVLLSTLKAKPFWNTPALPILFTVSALSTGSALLASCVGVWPLPAAWLAEGAGSALAFQMIGEELVHMLHLLDAVLIIVEIIVLLIFVILQRAAGNETAKIHAQRWLTGSMAGLFWGGMVLGGLVVPFLLYQVGGVFASAIAPVLVLAGGLLLRFMIVFSDERRTIPGEREFYRYLPKGDEQFLHTWR